MEVLGNDHKASTESDFMSYRGTNLATSTINSDSFESVSKFDSENIETRFSNIHFKFKSNTFEGTHSNIEIWLEKPNICHWFPNFIANKL